MREDHAYNEYGLNERNPMTRRERIHGLILAKVLSGELSGSGEQIAELARIAHDITKKSNRRGVFFYQQRAINAGIRLSTKTICAAANWVHEYEAGCLRGNRTSKKGN